MAKSLKNNQEPDAVDDILALVANGDLKPEHAKVLITKIKKENKVQTIFNVSDMSSMGKTYGSKSFSNNTGSGCHY